MKIVYLDQFVIKRAFCPATNDPHRDFFVQVGELCIKLAKMGVVSFPFSGSHLKETASLSDQAQKDLIAENFATLSNGYRFAPAMGVPQMQACAARKGQPQDWSPHKVVYANGRIGFRELLRFTQPPDRDSQDTTLKQVLMYWQSLTPQKLRTIADREARTYVRLLTQDFARIMAGGMIDPLKWVASPFHRLFLALEMDAREDGVEDSITDAYAFICNRIMEVPCIRFASELWEEFATAKHKTLHKENDPANTAEDIEFISCFVPYCDAAFLDRAMTARLRESNLLVGHKTELFSLKHRKDEFLQYLSGLEKEHVTPVSPETFSAFEAERLSILRQRAQPLLWICFVPTYPDSLVRLKTVSLQSAPDSLLECRILPGGGIERIETIPATTSVSSSELESRIRIALGRIMAVPREGCHVSMQVNYSLVNCAGMQIESHSTSHSKRIHKDLLRLGVSDWYTDSPDLLWPKPDEIMAALFQSESSKRSTKGRRVSAAPTGLG